jgi:hypothetical protein
MFAFDRRITLEDQGGVKKAAYLLEVIAGHSFVLCPVSAAQSLQGLDPDQDWEDACELLARHLQVMDIRTHRFLPGYEAIDVLRQSACAALQAVALLWEIRVETDAVWSQDTLTPQAFAAECRRRTSHP